MKNYECLGGPDHGKRHHNTNGDIYQVAILDPDQIKLCDAYKYDSLLTMTYKTKVYHLMPFSMDGYSFRFWVFEDLTVEDAVGYCNVDAVGYCNVMASALKYKSN